MYSVLSVLVLLTVSEAYHIIHLQTSILEHTELLSPHVKMLHLGLGNCVSEESW